MISKFSRDVLMSDFETHRQTLRRGSKRALAAKAEIPIAFDLVVALAAAIALTVTIFGLLAH